MNLLLFPRSKEQAPAIVLPKLVGNWPLTDAPGTQAIADYSGNNYTWRNGSSDGPDNNDVTLTGTEARWDSYGTDGVDDYMRLTSVALSLGKVYTVMAVTYYPAGGSGYVFGMGSAGTGLYFTSGKIRAMGVSPYSELDCPSDQYNIVGARSDDSVIQVYLNGAFGSTSTSNDTGSTWFLGSYNGTTSTLRYGRIAYALLYSDKLSDAEMAQNRLALKSIMSGRGIALP